MNAAILAEWPSGSYWYLRSTIDRGREGLETEIDFNVLYVYTSINIRASPNTVSYRCADMRYCTF